MQISRKTSIPVPARPPMMPPIATALMRDLLLLCTAGGFLVGVGVFVDDVLVELVDVLVVVVVADDVERELDVV